MVEKKKDSGAARLFAVFLLICVLGGCSLEKICPAEKASPKSVVETMIYCTFNLSPSKVMV